MVSHLNFLNGTIVGPLNCFLWSLLQRVKGIAVLFWPAWLFLDALWDMYQLLDSIELVKNAQDTFSIL